MIILQRSLAVLGVAIFLAELPGEPFTYARVTQPEDNTDDAAQVADEAEEEIVDDPAGSQGPSQEGVVQQGQAIEVSQHALNPTADATKLPEDANSNPGPAAPMQAIIQPVVAESTVGIDAQNAHIAAASAMDAAKVANRVAAHSVHITKHARDSLKNAQDAVHKARVTTEGLSKKQKSDLKKAEAKLKEASKTAEYGTVKDAHYIKAEVDNKKLQKLESKMKTVKKVPVSNELDVMQKEIGELREQLKAKAGDTSEEEAALQDLEDQIMEMEKAEAKNGQVKSHDEIKAELERLRKLIADMEDGSDTYKEQATQPQYPVKMKKVDDVAIRESQDEVTPVSGSGIDIDTAMPYGDLEPFGREDTAQELTEDSIRESDGMVDQLERAEVAEEKRAVFRALTRLRGAAITSFDGIARSQTGQIDEYNKIHQWRATHPLHHLADEESDVSKWAFPDNAD